MEVVKVAVVVEHELELELELEFEGAEEGGEGEGGGVAVIYHAIFILSSNHPLNFFSSFSNLLVIFLLK